MNKAVVIVVGLVSLLGAAAGGMAHLGVPPFGAPAAAQTVVAEVVPATVVVPPTFVDAGLVGVPVIKGNKVVKSVVLQLQLDVEPGAKSRIEANLPRLQHGFLADLMAFMPAHLKDRSQVDIAAVKRRLAWVCERVIGPGAVREVLIMGIQER